MDEIQHYYAKVKEPAKSCLLALRQVILQEDKAVTETTKWGMPCFCYSRKNFCFLWTDKTTGEPYILFVEGNQLQHPSLEQGNRAKMKILRVDPNKDLPIESIRQLIQQALNVYKKRHS